MDFEELEDLFQQAAHIERMLPDHDRRRLDAKCGWPDYLYDLDDKKDQEPEMIKLRLNSSQIALLEKVSRWLNLLGIRTDKRTVMGKKIIWARANNYSYREIAYVSGLPPKTCENWYKADMKRLLRRLNT